MAWKKNFKKGAKKAGRWANRKIAKPYVTGNPKRTRKARMNLYSEIAAIKKVINVEKKRNVVSYTSDLSVGQVVGNTQGWYAVDITPTPSQGSNSTQRNGDSIKLTGSNLLFSMRQQSAAASSIKCKIVIFHITGVGQPYTPATFIDDIYYQNTFVLNAGSPAIIDYNSQLDIYNQKGYKILASKTVYMPYDAQSGILGVKNFRMGIKYKNHHIKYANGTTTVNNGQLIMYIQPDCGNCSSTTACTLTGVPVTAVNTGLFMNWNITHYFVDN